MRQFSTVLIASATAGSLFACMIDDAPAPAPKSQFCTPAQVDVDGDGRADGLDTNCDGAIDVALGCLPRRIDVDGDGVDEGLDLDCDGAIDVSFGSSGSGGGSGGSGSGSGSGSSCAQEQEVNNTPSQANPATSSTDTLALCGSLATSGDVDYFRFMVNQAGTLTLSVTATSDAQATLTAPNGSSAQTGAGGGAGGGRGGSATITGPAGTYLVKIASSHGTAQSYSARIAVK